jgi:hypothetical protein
LPILQIFPKNLKEARLNRENLRLPYANLSEKEPPKTLKKEKREKRATLIAKRRAIDYSRRFIRRARPLPRRRA